MAPCPLAPLLVAALVAVCIVAQNTYLEGGIYQQIEAFGAVRLLNASGVSGPAAQWPTSGIVYQIMSKDDLETFMNFSPTFVSFAVIMPFSMFTSENMFRLRNSNKLAGVIVIQNYESFTMPEFDSPDDVFPNFQFSLYANQSATPTYAWNPNGNGLLHQSFDFPVFVMPVNPNDLTWQQSTGTLLETAKSNMARGYTKYPLYSIEFNEFMYGSINADTCLRRGWCSPIGSSSIWSTFSYNISASDTKKIVIVSAQSDGIGYFYDFSNSAATTVSGYVALLAAAEALSHNQSAVVALPNDIIFTLFSTEQYGFAGSQRFVQDLTTPFKCLKNSTNGDTTASCAYSGAFCQNPCQVSGAFLNIGFDRISHILELSQVGGFTGANTTAAAAAEAVTHIYLHVDDATDSATLNLVDTLTGSIVIGNETEVASPMTVQFLPAFATAGTNDGNLRLPPSSAMSFLAKKKIPTVVLGDFRTNFTNPFYNSIYDDGGELTSVNIALMCSVATQTARSAFRLAGGSEADAAQFQADCDLIYELFICFTTNATCALFHSIYTGQTLPYVTSQPPTFTQQPFVTVPPFMMYNLLSNYTAAKRAENTCNSTDSSPNCSGAQSGAQCVSNACVWSQTNTHYAYGTGLEMDYTTSQFVVVDPTKATWVISGFNSTNQRIRTFLTSSPLYQGIQVGVGVALTLVVTAATYYLQRHVDARFNKA